MTIKMPPSQAGDGAMLIKRLDDGKIVIDATIDGVTYHIEVSAYNAWRVFGCLALMLGIPLPKATGKAIKLGEDFKAVIG